MEQRNLLVALRFEVIAGRGKLWILSTALVSLGMGVEGKKNGNGE